MREIIFILVCSVLGLAIGAAVGYAQTGSALSLVWRGAGIGCLVGITLVAASLDIISVLFDLFD